MEDLKWGRFFISGTERLKKLWAKLLTLAATKSMTSSSWEIGANIWTKILWVTSLATLFQNGDRDALSEGRPRTGREGEAGEERGEGDQRRPGVWYPRAAQQVTGVYMNEYMNEYMNIRDYFSFGFAHQSFFSNVAWLRSVSASKLPAYYLWIFFVKRNHKWIWQVTLMCSMLL